MKVEQLMGIEKGMKVWQCRKTEQWIKLGERIVSWTVNESWRMNESSRVK